MRRPILHNQQRTIVDTKNFGKNVYARCISLLFFSDALGTSGGNRNSIRVQGKRTPIVTRGARDGRLERARTMVSDVQHRAHRTPRCLCIDTIVTSIRALSYSQRASLHSLSHTFSEIPLNFFRRQSTSTFYLCDCR